MKLKKIDILGFKSFADKTQLSFHPGITAVVGPNGCGKSNISDSFRWVLGEQSAKSMRGAKMQDIIFAGTTQRKPLNIAEVTITLCDVKGALPVEYEEVAVTRRLHRNGESEYFLNRRAVRLKDIYDLFLDTGVGKNAFSIFEQGKLDQVINLSPLERRYIFEEAAGILRFLQRKREALKRLEQTEQNIARLKDIHLEVEKQINLLEKQAEKARIYKGNKTELETLEISLFCAKWENMEKRRKAAKERSDLQHKELAAAESELHALDIQRQNENIRCTHIQKELQAQKEKVYLKRSEKEIKTKETQAGDQRLQEMVAKEKRWCLELEERILKRKNRQAEVEIALRQLQKVEAECLEIEGVRKYQKEKVALLEVRLAEVRQKQQEMQNTLLKHLQEESSAEGELKQTTLKLEYHREKKKSLFEHQTGLAQQLEALKDAAEIKSKERDASSALLDQTREHAEAVEHQIEENGLQTKETRAAIDRLYREKAEDNARRNVLRRMREEMEGFSSGTKKMLQESAKPGSVLHGKVAGLHESLVPKEGAARALSVVMRPYLQTLFVRSREDFHAVLDYAKEKQIRDFSLLCLEYLGEEASTPAVATSTLLERMEDTPIARHFLSRILWVEDPAAALAQVVGSKDAGAWAEEGAYVDFRGVMFFANEGEKNVFLREAELKALEKKIHDKESALSRLEQNLQQLNEARIHLQGRKKEIDQYIRTGEMRLVEIEYTLQRMQAETERSRKEMERVQKESDQIAELDNRLVEHLATQKERHANALAQVANARADADALSIAYADQLEALKHEQLDLQQKEAFYHKTTEEKRKIQNTLNVLEVKEIESRQQEKRLEEEIDDIQEKQVRLQQDRLGYSQQIQEIDAALAEVQASCRELEEMACAVRNGVSEFEARLSEKREELKKRQSDLYETGIQAAQLESSAQALEHELLERYRLSISAANAASLPLDRSIEKAEKDVRALRRQLEEAGDVNMTSIEEFEQYKTRYEFLTQQIADLTLSKEELVQIITQLDGESRRLFKVTFAAIRENFKKNFQILFRGGESDLHFTEEGDILEAGVEIIAKPPGKQMRSIQLLSGGEKCLTAIALLFAIFEVKPAPFCILDEIDAPLDDTNVERFVDVVKQFTDKCQFIIITHNKRTMAIADVIYGVSMQERGVSKILSLEFSRERETDPVVSLEV